MAYRLKAYKEKRCPYRIKNQRKPVYPNFSIIKGWGVFMVNPVGKF